MTSQPQNTSTYPPQNAKFYLNLSVYWFALSLLWGGLISIVIQTLVERITPDKKDLYLGWTLGAGAFISTLIGLVIGTVSDRSRRRMGKRRPYIIVGSLLAVPCLLWLGFLGSAKPSLALIPFLIVDFCLLQFWVNVATSPYQALVPDLVPKERQGTASAYMGMGSLIGQLGGLLLCGFMIQKENGIWIIVTTLSVVLTGAMLYTLRIAPEASAEENPAPPVSLWGATLESFRVNPKEHPDFFWLIASRFVINLGFYTAMDFLLYYVSDTLRAPNPANTVLAIFVIATVSGLAGNFPAGIWADRISKKRIIYIANLITGISCLVFLSTSNLTVALGTAFLFGAGFGAFQAVDWAFATNLLPNKDEAKYMGLWHSAFTVPQVVAPIIGGPIAYLFNHGALQPMVAEYGTGFGYRVILFLVIFYYALGSFLLRYVRETPVPLHKPTA